MKTPSNKRSRLSRRKIPLAVAFVLLAFSVADGQVKLTLRECMEKGEANYPLIRQRKLLETTRAFSIENVSRGQLPQVSLGGQATYQSEVTRIPFDVPGAEPLDKDQYRVFGEISQTLYHGGLVRQQVRAEEANAATEEAKLEVELYQVRNRINDLFFGIILLQEQIRQSNLVRDDLAATLRKTEAAIINGVAIRSAGDVLRAESLRVDQRIIELRSTRKSYREMLGLFINEPLGDTVVFEKPTMTTREEEDIARPELELFRFQRQALDVSRGLLGARKRPRLEFFVQGGYGRPALNMLENEFRFYYIGGVRLSWLLSGYYTFAKEKQLLTVRQQSLDVQRETFLFNTRLTLRQELGEFEKLRGLMEVDDEIIALRTRVKETASVQLEQGVISASDYVREVNAEDRAIQDRVLHEVQLLMAQARYEFTNGH